MPFPKKPAKKQCVYLDHAATTPLDPLVLAAMKPWLTTNFANPSALYASAVAARNAIEDARKQVAEILGTQSDTIMFTGSGTESTNMAILGIGRNKEMRKLGNKRHIITTAIEHHAVLNPIKQLEKEGWSVTYLPVNKQGTVNSEQVRNALRSETMLVSIMYANNEIGSIQPIGDIGREILKWRKTHGTPYPYFHTDACQAAGYLDLSVDRLHVDLMSVNGSKIYGPKGVGVLYKRRGVKIEPLVYGGGQEFGLRSGTENVAGIVGMEKAMELMRKLGNREMRKLSLLRDYFWKRIQEEIPEVELNGPTIYNSSPIRGGKPARLDDVSRSGGGGVSKCPMSLALDASRGTLRPPPASPYKGEYIDRLPNNLNITFKNTDAEALILYLDEYGIQCSSGSACATDSDEVSHVLLACGLSEDDSKSSIRFTLGNNTTKQDIDYVMKYLPKVVEEMRKMKKP